MNIYTVNMWINIAAEDSTEASEIATAIEDLLGESELPIGTLQVTNIEQI